MTQDTSTLLHVLARRTALETFTAESEPAVFETTKGEQTLGVAEADVSRSSIALRFITDKPLEIGEAAYGESSGQMTTLSGSWKATRINFVGTSAMGEHLFVTQELTTNRLEAEKVAATRLVYAGAGWDGEVVVNGARAIATTLSKEAVNHHDARLALAIEGKPSERAIAVMGRASSIVAGLDIEPLRIDFLSAQGGWIRTRHLRGARRVGRGPHSPFTGLDDAHRMAAWAAIVGSLPRLEDEGVPITRIINLIASSNQVAEIDAGACLLLLATQALAHFRVHGPAVGSGGTPRTHDLAELNRDLILGLGPEDLERFERLRVELLDTGMFQHPGYETGRPQKDIKFLRDIAHLIVFRICSYAGPFYCAEKFSVRR